MISFCIDLVVTDFIVHWLIIFNLSRWDLKLLSVLCIEILVRFIIILIRWLLGHSLYRFKAHLILHLIPTLGILVYLNWFGYRCFLLHHLFMTFVLFVAHCLFSGRGLLCSSIIVRLRLWLNRSGGFLGSLLSHLLNHSCLLPITNNNILNRTIKGHLWPRFIMIIGFLFLYVIRHDRFSKLIDHCVDFLLLDFGSLWSHYWFLNIDAIAFFLAFLRSSTLDANHCTGHSAHSNRILILIIFNHFSVLLFDNPHNLIIHLFLKNHFHLILNKIFNPLYDYVQPLFNACGNFTVYSFIDIIKVLANSEVIIDLHVLLIGKLFEHVWNC